MSPHLTFKTNWRRKPLSSLANVETEVQRHELHAWIRVSGRGWAGSVWLRAASLQSRDYTVGHRPSVPLLSEAFTLRGTSKLVTLISGTQTSHRDSFRGLILSSLLCGRETQKDKKIQFSPRRR